MTNKVLSVDCVCADGTILIVEFPTGIHYEAQCGGIACLHPTFEGFVIGLGDFMQGVNDCSYGCSHIQYMKERQEKLALEIDRELKILTRDWRNQIRFDFDRIAELMEGWWPVIVEGELDPWNKFSGKFRGIIHTGNCD